MLQSAGRALAAKRGSCLLVRRTRKSVDRFSSGSAVPVATRLSRSPWALRSGAYHTSMALLAKLSASSRSSEDDISSAGPVIRASRQRSGNTRNDLVIPPRKNTMDCGAASISVCRINSRSSASESWAHSNASSPAAGAASINTRIVAGRGRKNKTASRTSDRIKLISVLSGGGARKAASPKVMAVDPGEDWRIPRTIRLVAAWEVLTAGKRKRWPSRHLRRLHLDLRSHVISQSLPCAPVRGAVRTRDSGASESGRRGGP